MKRLLCAAVVFIFFSCAAIQSKSDMHLPDCTPDEVIFIINTHENVWIEIAERGKEMKEENMGTRDTINTRGSARSGKVRVIWGSEGISTGDTLTEKQKVELIKIVLKRAGKGNFFDLHTLPAETRFLIETLDNVHIHMFSEDFDNSGRDWLIIAADEATARREANKI